MKKDISKIGIVFGGEDHEEQAAREVARKAGVAFIATATVSDQKNNEPSKVHPGNAKFATGYTIDEGSDKGVEAVIIFENNPQVAGDIAIVLNADHHNPGDTGFELPPDKYFEASSLGQLMKYLKVEPDEYQLMVAAGDHCPADAYAGNCPGIDVEKFSKFRLQKKVDFYKKHDKFKYKSDLLTLQGIIEKTKQLLNSSEVNEDGIIDLRGKGLIDELPESALILGKSYMTSIPDTDKQGKPTGNTKVLMGGHTTEDMINKFMEWGKQQPNVADVYGNPIRGFAGVILKPDYTTQVPGILYPKITNTNGGEFIIEGRQDLREDITNNLIRAQDMGEKIRVTGKTFGLALKALSDFLQEKNSHASKVLKTMSNNQLIGTPWVEIKGEINEESIKKYISELSGIQLEKLLEQLSSNNEGLSNNQHNLFIEKVNSALEGKNAYKPEKSWKSRCHYSRSIAYALQSFKEWYGDTQIIEMFDEGDMGIGEKVYIDFNKEKKHNSDTITVSRGNCHGQCFDFSEWGTCQCGTSWAIPY